MSLAGKFLLLVGALSVLAGAAYLVFLVRVRLVR